MCAKFLIKLINVSKSKGLNNIDPMILKLSANIKVFLSEVKIMYKIYINLASNYVHETFQMREVNLEKILSNEFYI